MTSILSKARTALVCGLAMATLSIGPARAFDDAEKAEIGQIVKEYLLANPEVMIEVQQALEDKQQAETRDRQKEIISAASAEIFTTATDPVLGNPDGAVTVVEFFDYNCGFCKRAVPDMTGMIEADKELRWVLKEFPIFGPNSEQVHTVAVAFHRLKPEVYNDYHLKMMAQEERVDEATAIRIAVEMGADEDALRKEMADPAIAEELQANQMLASSLGITGTPSYVIGDEVVIGALGRNTLETKVANMRDCNSTVC